MAEPIYSAIVQELVDMIENENWDDAFEQAVTDANETGVREMKDIRCLTDFYKFLDTLVSWVPREDDTGTTIYKMLCTVYFILGQKTVKPFQSLIKPLPRSEKLTRLSKWIVDYAIAMGKFLDKPESLTEDTLKSFKTAQNYNVDSYEVPEGGWHTFNEFFARKVLPGTRPIDGSSNPMIIVSAADSKFSGGWDIKSDSYVNLKGIGWPISQLLADSQYANDFANGKLMHAFLAPYDYHRLHAPVDGKVLEAKIIKGQACLDVIVESITPMFSPQSVKVKVLKAQRNLTAPDSPDQDRGYNTPNSPGYQFCQVRGLIVIDSPIGKVAVLPIGMAQVSSVVLSVKEGDTVKKGETEISYFQFGGSDVVLVFEEKCKVDILATIDKHYRVGQQIALSHVRV